MLHKFHAYSVQIYNVHLNICKFVIFQSLFGVLSFHIAYQHETSNIRCLDYEKMQDIICVYVAIFFAEFYAPELTHILDYFISSLVLIDTIHTHYSTGTLNIFPSHSLVWILYNKEFWGNFCYNCHFSQSVTSSL